MTGPARVFLALGLVVVFTGPAIRAQELSGEELPLRPGDAIRLSLSREVDLSGDYPVDEAGNVGLPLIGVRQVNGIPAAQLKQQLIDAYEEQLRNQTVQVILLRRVRVLGAVNQPGLYHVDPTMTLGDAVALAGGATPVGRMDEVKIVRAGREIDADMTDSAFRQIRSGDHVLVPERNWFTRNTGLIVGASLSVLGILLSQL